MSIIDTAPAPLAPAIPLPPAPTPAPVAPVPAAADPLVALAAATPAAPLAPAAAVVAAAPPTAQLNPPPAAPAAPIAPVPTLIAGAKVDAPASIHLSHAAASPSYYSRFAIQPLEFARHNNLTSWQANVIKYILRADAKNGEEDIQKAISVLVKELAFQQGDPNWINATVA